MQSYTGQWRIRGFDFSKQLKLSQDQSPIPSSYADWLQAKFPHVASKPLAQHHREFWAWIEGLSPGTRPQPLIIVWPRGGAKSTTAELGTVYASRRKSRKFVLYVCSTQDQADLHVRSIAALFETLGVDRAVNKHGNSKGWRRDQLITADGFAVAGLGLDVAVRGIKIEEFRPDLIILDDIDSQEDTARTTEKKVAAITKAILPAGSADCAVLGIQNLVHEDSIFAQLVDGRADFLLDRCVPPIVRAVEGLEYESFQTESGANQYRITGGAPAWEGQDLATCERQINDWGLHAFLTEAQHEVKGAQGYFFDHTRFEVVDSAPELVRLCRAWDLAATEGGGDYTAGTLMGIAKNGVCYVLDVIRGQMSSDRVRRTLLDTARGDVEAHGKIRLHIPQDPGQAGKDQSIQFRSMLQGIGHELKIEPVTGKKAVRARGYADAVNVGNVKLLRAAWNRDFILEHRKFREDEEHENDDQVDSAADAFNELMSKRKVEMVFY